MRLSHLSLKYVTLLNLLGGMSAAHAVQVRNTVVQCIAADEDDVMCSPKIEVRLCGFDLFPRWPVLSYGRIWVLLIG